MSTGLEGRSDEDLVMVVNLSEKSMFIWIFPLSYYTSQVLVIFELKL